MTTEDLTMTDLAFTISAAAFAVASAINMMAEAEYMGMMYAILAMVLVTYVQTDRNRRQTREIRNLLKQWPPLPRSNDTTAAEWPVESGMYNMEDDPEGPKNRRY
jgi:predicted lipoprotein with Yx(FWY)xxD motif